MSSPIRTTLLLALLVLVLAAGLFMALVLGSVHIGLGEFWASIAGNRDVVPTRVVLELRLPRALAAIVTGGLLGLAGALMQVLLRNPLADPYVLGISGGAAVGALGSMLLGWAAAWVTGSALAGALLSMLLVFGLAHGAGSWNPTRLLLTGVVVAAGWGAVIAFLLSVSPNQRVHGMLFWLMGDLAYAGDWRLPGVVLVLGLAAGFAMARGLNLLTRGEQQAAALGLSVGKVRVAIYVLASLTTAAAVTLAGSVGFVGLVVPHMLRLAGASDHRQLLPAAVLAGGALLVIADTLARTLFAPTQLPVGVLTALLGVPLFLFLLYRNR